MGVEWSDPDAILGDEREELHDKPIDELLKQLASETSTLVHQELELAKDDPFATEGLA